MKKWIYTLSLMGALAVGANADVIEHVAPQLVDGCYQITNAGELFGFADIVNGTNSATKNASACGKLVHDLRIVQFPERPVGNDDSGEEQQYAFGPNSHVVPEDLSQYPQKTPIPYNIPEDNRWTPMVDFSGIFDGQGHTISGLFYSGNSAGFFASLTGVATVKRLNINDSYFAADDYAGGFAALAFGEDSISITDCSFNGVIDAINDKEHSNLAAGGIVGKINAPTKLSLTTCSNEGYILHLNTSSDANSGGLIGVISEGLKDKLVIKDNICYGFVGGSSQRGVVGKMSIARTDIPERKNNFCYGTGELCGNKQVCDKNNTLNQCKWNLKKAVVDSLNAAGFKGVSFEFNEIGHIIIAHLTEWNDYETKQEVLQELYMPRSVIADSVDFDRVFTGTSSTIMLPFDITPSNVKDQQGKIVSFNTISIEKKDNKWEAEAITQVSEIEAQTPYLVNSVNGNIHFHGPVTLKQIIKIDNPKNSKKKDSLQICEYPINVNANWDLVGTYKTMLTTSKNDTASSEYEKESKLGKIYGFVGTAGVSDNGYNFTLGEFAVAGHNVRTREMRAYLIYNENTPSPALAPAYRGMPMLRAASVVSVDELPDRIPVKLTSKPIIPESQFIDPTLKTTRVVATIKTKVPEIDCEKDCEEGTTAITKPFIIPMKASKVDRWQDAMGRRLNGKPTKHGTYFKNGIPVIIK